MPKSIQVVLWVLLGFAVFLGLLRFVFYFVAWWAVKWLAKAGERLNTAQPRRISLLPRDAIEWSQPERVAQMLQALEAAGFVDAGRYELKEMNGIKLQGMVHPEQRIAAVVYDHATVSMLDVGVDYDDGRSICYGNHQLGFALARPDHLRQQSFPGLSAAELLERLRSECPVEGRMAIPAERFAFWVEEQYARHAQWLAERGGPTLEETVQMVKAGGHTADDETVREMHETSTEGYLKHWLHNQPDWTDKDHEWDELEGGLVVIHDGLQLETVLERFNERVPVDAELAQSDIPAGLAGAREAFAHLNQRAGYPYRVLLEKRVGLATDYYLETDTEEAVEPDSERKVA